MWENVKDIMFILNAKEKPNKAKKLSFSKFYSSSCEPYHSGVKLAQKFREK